MKLILSLLFSALALYAFEVEAQESLTLEQAQARLAQANEDWEIQALRVQRSQALRRQALASMLPNLSAAATGSYNGQEVVFGDRVIRPLFDWSASVNAGITLFDGSLYPLYSQAGKLVEVTELEGAWVRQALRYEVAETFYQLAAAQRRVEIAQRTLELREAYVERAQALSEAGIGLPLDVARAKTQHLEAQQVLVQATAQLGDLSDALAVLIGTAPEDTELRADTQEDAHRAPPENATVDIAQRRDLEAQRARVEASEYAESSILWGLLPSLQLNGNYRIGPPSFTNPDGTSWSVSLSLVWLLYDGGARYARLEAVRTETAEAALRVDQQRRRAKGEVRQALRNWHASFEEIRVAQQRLELAREAYEMVQARFESGLVTSIEVDEASDVLFRAEIDLNQAQLLTDIAAARYLYLSGLDDVEAPTSPER